MTSIPEKKDGSNLTREDLENKSIKSEFAKKEKFCKFCGKELEQRCWRANGITKYFPVWQECDCEQAQAAKQREIEEQENLAILPKKLSDDVQISEGQDKIILSGIKVVQNNFARVTDSFI